MNEPYPLKLQIPDFELLQGEGVFDKLKKVELIEGAIVAMNAEYRPHTYAKSELHFRLRLALEELGSRYTAVVEPTLALPPHNLPEPDLMVVDAPRERDYFRIEHVAIVIEVSDTTLDSDLGVKRKLYAASGIPEYWVVDLTNNRLHQLWGPHATEYEHSRTTSLAGELRSITMPDLAIKGASLR